MTAAARLEEIQARADKATDGPWAAHVDRFQDESYRDIDGAWIPGVAEKGFYEGDKPALSMLDPEDAEFIAHAREDVPWLIEQVRKRDAALRAVLDLCDSTPEPYMPVRQAEIHAAIEAALGEVNS